MTAGVSFQDLYREEGRLSFNSLFADPEAVFSNWHYGPEASFRRLEDFDAYLSGAEGIGGVYLLGVGSKRLYALTLSSDHDVGSAIERLKSNRMVSFFNRYGPVRATWMRAPEEVWPGIVRYLTTRLTPLLNKKCPIAPPVSVPIPREFGGTGNLRPRGIF